jgi:exosortase/archaeosortase family protein
MLSKWKQQPFLIFAIRFILGFFLLYGGMHLLTGLTVRGGYYSPFLDKYFDLVSGLRSSLIYGAQTLADALGLEAHRVSERLLKVPGGRGVIVSYSCLGVGVLSFWLALMWALPQNWKRRIIWMIFGSFILWVINVCRIGLFLMAINKGWPMPLGLDHHTWFNIVSYFFIFILLYFFDRSPSGSVKK